MKLGSKDSEPFLGRDLGQQADYSDEIAATIDTEVRALIEQAHTEAWQVVNANREILDRLALELLEKETLDHNQIAEIFTGITQLPERPQWLSSPERPVSSSRRSSSRRRRRRSAASVASDDESAPTEKPKKRAPRATPRPATA